MTEKIKAGKLALSLIVYLFGIPIFTMLIALIIGLLLQIPAFSWLINVLMNIRESNGWEILVLPMVLSSFIGFLISKK